MPGVTLIGQSVFLPIPSIEIARDEYLRSRGGLDVKADPAFASAACLLDLFSRPGGLLNGLDFGL